ncbi:MAG: hypothetical protein F4X82_00215 [Candidatus Spechtbacteria bacterium SB0662_bin_43]|uniref:Uncharacterized protein n=1 Tax=Candidatus Spechtbacteria bacterium SB0662_bin_43 TaxID=2604897 RepID=A0A845DBC7_9BACT|nr:hypothetical protein [Candidatus Spechtbacteria bacterium SB0662_bin_43]
MDIKTLLTQDEQKIIYYKDIMVKHIPCTVCHSPIRNIFTYSSQTGYKHFIQTDKGTILQSTKHPTERIVRCSDCYNSWYHGAGGLLKRNIPKYSSQVRYA